MIFLKKVRLRLIPNIKIFQEIIESKEQLLFAALTSYGKSELILKHLSKNNDKSKVAIIVPTKVN